MEGQIAAVTKESAQPTIIHEAPGLRRPLPQYPKTCESTWPPGGGARRCSRQNSISQAPAEASKAVELFEFRFESSKFSFFRADLTGYFSYALSSLPVK
jgi:hypothetical protein